MDFLLVKVVYPLKLYDDENDPAKRQRMDVHRITLFYESQPFSHFAS